MFAPGRERARLVFEFPVFGDASKVSLSLFVGARARGAGYAVLRSAVLCARLTISQYSDRVVERNVARGMGGILTSAMIFRSVHTRGVAG